MADPDKSTCSEEDRDRRASLEAAWEWSVALREVARGERDPRAAVEATRDLALSRTAAVDVQAAIRETAGSEMAKADALAELGTKGLDLARTRPTREQWAESYDDVIGPAAGYRGPIQFCECGKPFNGDGRRSYCSDDCAKRAQDRRRRERRQAEKEEAERALKEHDASCASCRRGAPCEDHEGLLDVVMGGRIGTYTAESLYSTGDVAEWADRPEDEDQEHAEDED